MKIYQDSTVLITGASAGIGMAMARQLAAQGAHVLLTARRGDRLQTLADEIIAAGGKASFVTADLRNETAAKKLFDWATDQGLTVDVLINNAGLGLQADFVEGDQERYRDILRVNLESLVDLTRYFLPAMKERGQGGVLNVASVAAFQAIPSFQVYAASKAFVLSFSEALWYECRGSGVHVSCLCPGATETEFFEVAGISVKKAREWGMQSAELVADIGLRGLLKNKPVVLTSKTLKFQTFLGRLLPRRWVTATAGWMISRMGSTE